MNSDFGLEEEQLHPFLIGKPTAETAFLLLGTDYHLLLAPGGLLSMIPFGVPLNHRAEGGLYVQAGRDFSPPLPASACTSIFACGENDIIAVSNIDDAGEIRAQRYALDQAIPVWSLWLTQAPAVAEGVSGPQAKRLLQVAEAIKPAVAEQNKWLRRLLPFSRRQQGQSAGKDRLLGQALREERAGNYARAAELLEEAGEMAAAGRLYERAAGV